MLTQNRLKEVLSYNEETGAFTRKDNFKCNQSSGDAGHVNAYGYVQISIDGKRYMAHRLAWLYVNGEFPLEQVDHINGERGDNSITNLRQVSRSGNCQNQRKAHKQNRTGLLGVTAARGRFNAVIGLNGKQLFLGAFDTPELAGNAYLAAKRELHATCTI